MKSRIVQDQIEYDGGGRAESPPLRRPHVSRQAWRPGSAAGALATARRRSSDGRFVVVVFMAGGAIGTQIISTVDTFSGESPDAEVAATDAGLRQTKRSC